MDDVPFLEFNLEKIRETQIEEVKKFCKENFDLDNILSSANELKYMSEVKKVIRAEFAEPSPELVKMLTKRVYEGIVTQKVLDQFTDIVKSIVITVNEKYIPTLTGVEMVSTNVTKEYVIGDNVSFAGLKIYAVYDNGAKKDEISLSDENVTVFLRVSKRPIKLVELLIWMVSQQRPNTEADGKKISMKSSIISVLKKSILVL